MFCCPGLECRSNAEGRGMCTKPCRCDPGALTCNDESIRDGCPPDAGLCVPFAPDGVGQCRARCDETPCSPGGGACLELSGADVPLCVPDLGAPPDLAGDLR